MAVSYVSKTFENSPYIPPLDLNLMAKVLSVKQGQFDANAEKIQSQVDSVASQDIMRGVDKNYVNSKLNNIVSNINTLGGVDLADNNITNQISGYASSIYNDDKVISAISSTKRARSLMSSYDKMKSDPKLIKYYSEANEYNDTKPLNSWMNDKNVGASYGGPSSATRYYDYNKDFQDILKNIVPQQFTKITTGNGYIEKETGKVVSERRVYEIAQGMLNPVQRDQMSRDATYLYEAKARYGKEQMVGKVLQHRDEELANEQDLLKQLRGSLMEANPVEKSKILKQIQEKTQYVTSLRNNKGQEAAYYSSLYDTNPQELMYRAYSNDYFNSLAKRYSVNQVDKSLVADQAMMNTFNQANQNARQDKEIKAAQYLQAMKDASATERLKLEYQLKGQLTNNSASISDPFATGNIVPNKSEQGKDERTKIAEDKMYEVKTQMQAIKNDYINSVVAENPHMTKEDASASFNVLSDALAEKSVMKDGLIKNLPAGFGEKFEQYNLLQHQHESYRRAAFMGEFDRPQYLTKTFTPDDQNNNKDPNYRVFEAIKTKLKNQGLINDTKDVILKEAYAAGEDSGGGYKITYVEGSGKKQGDVKTIDLTPETAAALGFVEPPNNLGILNRTVDVGKDYNTYIQNEKDPNFVAKIRVYKVKDGEFGAQYIYSNGVPINLLKLGNAKSPAEAYQNASSYVKKYRPSNTKSNKYQTKLDFEKDLGIPPEQQVETRNNTNPTWSAEDLKRYNVGNFQSPR